MTISSLPTARTMTGSGSIRRKSWTSQISRMHWNAEYADSFTDEMPSGKEEISLTVYLDNETYPTMEITLYRYDGSDCLAAVDGQPFAKISRSDVVELVEAVNAIVLTQPAA